MSKTNYYARYRSQGWHHSINKEILKNAIKVQQHKDTEHSLPVCMHQRHSDSNQQLVT